MATESTDDHILIISAHKYRHAKMSLRHILFLLLKLSFSTCQQASDPGSNNICNCDLTWNSCDVNCCCDADCTEEQRNVFSSCVRETLLHESQGTVCVPPNFIIFNQSTASTKTSNGLLCIYYDNYKERNFYEYPEEVIDEALFLEFRKKYGPDIEKKSAQAESGERSTDSFKVGDLMWAVRSDQMLGEWSLPRLLFSGLCSQPAPIEFWENFKITCRRKVQNMSASCESLPFLSASFYIQDIRLLKAPLLDAEINKKEITAAETVAVLPRESNQTATSRRPTWDAGRSLCLNVVAEVAFDVTVSSDGQIRSIKASWKTNSVDDSVFHQAFAVSFYWESDNVPLLKKSGNFGYEVGKPVLAGILRKGEEKEVVEVTKRPETWLTVVSSRNCADRQRVPILFGVDMQTGCLIELAADAQPKDCVEIGGIIRQALDGDARNRVAAFANASKLHTGDWLPIIMQNKPPNPENIQTGGCSKIVLGLDIELLFAKTGSILNPQLKITGVMFRYRLPTEIRFQCLGAECPGSLSVRKIPVTVTVTFLDVSERPRGAVAAIPTFDARLPADFFYPFTGSSNRPLNANLFLLFEIALAFAAFLFIPFG